MFVLVTALSTEARQDLVDRTGNTIEELADEDNVVEDVRVANLQAALRVWRDYPVLGTGPGRFGSTTAWQTRSPLHEEYGLPDVRSAEFAAQLEVAGDPREIDVGIAQLDLGWLQVTTELGGLGLASFLILSSLPAVRALRLQRFAATALVVALAVLSLGGPGVVDTSLAATIFWWTGVDLALARDESSD